MVTVLAQRACRGLADWRERCHSSCRRTSRTGRVIEYGGTYRRLPAATRVVHALGVEGILRREAVEEFAALQTARLIDAAMKPAPSPYSPSCRAEASIHAHQLLRETDGVMAHPVEVRGPWLSRGFKLWLRRVIFIPRRAQEAVGTNREPPCRLA